MHRIYSRVASILVSVIRMKVPKTDTSFLRCSGLFKVWNSSIQNAPSCYSYNK